MKRLLSTLLVFFILISFAYADMKPYAFPFIGRWQPSEDPVLIDDYGFQDIRNVRKDGKRLRGVAGHSLAVNNIINATYYNIANGFHFSKDQPSESNILVYALGSGDTISKVYKNTTTIPDTGDFTATALYTDATSPIIGRFSNAPQGNVLYCDSEGSMIWGGNELRCNAIYFSDDSADNVISNSRNYSSELSNSSDDADQIAAVNATYKYIIIGSPRPLQGIKAYVKTANDTVSTLTGWYWSGAWTSLTLTDNTAVGGITLATTGTVTWASTEDTAKKKLLEGLIYYWYQFEVSAGTAEIYYTTLDAPFQDITNIWNGTEVVVGACWTHDGTNYKDFTDEVNDDATDSVAVLDALDTTHSFLVGFTEPMQGLHIYFSEGKGNSDASVLTLKYWDGDSWVGLSDVDDGTDDGGDSFSKSGVIPFSAVGGVTEFETNISSEVPLYYYQCTFSVQLDAEVEIYYVRGIPATPSIPGYKFPGMYQGRALLFTETNGIKNRMRYSAYNSPDVWNGDDSGYLYFGGETELTASGVIYNVFRTTGYEQLIITKENETYRVHGDGPDNWESQQMSGTVGCVAPLSFVVCDVADITEDTKRHVAIWQSDSGIVMCDGATTIIISDDIRCYWDSNDSRYIPANRQDDSIGSYDTNLNSYKLLILSGAGQTTHNIELEYSLKNKEWTSIYRENASGAYPFQCIFPVKDTVGNKYTYGCTNTGFMYETESGTTWSGTDIEQYIHTKDLLLDEEQPFFRHTTINYLRLLFETKTGTTLSYLEHDDGEYLLTESGDRIVLTYGENITFTHYGDQELTVDDVNDQHVPENIALSTGPFETQDCLLGPSLIHSFKISGDFSTLTDGMELMGLGIGYEPLKMWIVEE